MKKHTGYLRLECAKKAEKTILQDAYFEGALKITRPLYLTQNGEVYLYIMNPGGGYLDGDSYRIEVELDEKAEAVLTTQSSTKIYKTLQQPAWQEVEIHLKKGSMLEYLPDPIIAYQHARFKQQTVVRMEKGATFICTDICTPGWAPDGSPFQYDLLQLRMDIYQDDQLILFDHVKLEPEKGLKKIGRMEEYTHFGTMIVINEQVNHSLLDELYELICPFTESAIGLSMLNVPGFTLRILAHSTQEIENIIHCCHEKVKQTISDKPVAFLRKY